MIKNFVHLLALMFICVNSHTQVCKVSINEKDGNWKLMVNDEPYFIKGAGGDKYLDILIGAGGNTIRTWGTENAQQVLDEAHKKGLKVMLGLWVQHERHGFDYNNKERVKAQLDRFRKEVQKYKEHPALLLWGIGNEYELNYSNTKVWKAVNDIAKMIHEEDPYHPTSTVTAGTNADKLKFVMEELTEVDIYGINTYADIVNVKKVLKEGNFNGPYMITEWGPTGHWEIKKTMWGASVEQSSTAKANSYLSRYKENIDSQKKQCIGSFAFLWGQKQEYTSTWYGLFSEEGIPTEAIDVLQYCWKGSYPEKRSPSIDSLTFGAHSKLMNTILVPGDKYSVQVYASDSNKDNLSYRWELYPESTDLKTGCDAEGKPPIITGKIKGGKSEKITLKAPTSEGRYRLFVFVTDGEKLAYMNVPFYVDDSLQEFNNVKFKIQDLEPTEY